MRRHWTTAALVVIVLVAATRTGAAQPAEAAEPQIRIELAELKTLVARRSVIVVDVRDRSSYEAAHIPDAQWVPAPQLQTFAQDYARRRDTRTVVTYCS